MAVAYSLSSAWFFPIDNNAVENAIRPFVVGRKNWLFSGSLGGADSIAGLYSIIETAKGNGLEPYWYMRYLFEKLTNCQNDDEIYKLLPNKFYIIFENFCDLKNFKHTVLKRIFQNEKIL